ncbi:MAG TPA: hypothetical protein VGG99_02735 [Acetobacteraceae bacterium]|jgi:hypothetical protein
MMRIGGFVFGATVMAAASAAYAQAPGPAASGTVQAPFVPPESPATINRSPPVLFWIANLPVRMWAPVEPSYDDRANRNGAANPLWGVP